MSDESYDRDFILYCITTIFHKRILFNVCAFEFVKCTTSATAIAKTSSLSNTLFLKGILQKILHPYNKD
jgi:hypothetical protein